MIGGEHGAFLGAIFKRPEDVTTRLVYADWLDEHDHPGGELIRLRQQLALPDLPKTKRTTLAARERKALAKCDRDWLVLLERADWKQRYLQVRPANEYAADWQSRRKRLWSAPAQKAMSRALAAFEKEIGLQLPCSWKAFAHACGGGRLCGDWIWVPTKGGDMGQRQWSVWKTATNEQFDRLNLTAEVRSWIRSSVRFGNGSHGDILVWNTSRVTDPVRVEYEVVWLTSPYQDRIETFESFEAMWSTRVAETRNADGDEGRPFEPE